ncbi:MAG TPA: guanylate kinase [Candidatus Magasanikbacteria bacterium]|mgnify:CR=1 FL=1|nr:guanylate kinase [Candidatus Magasanikbacteria bacterium]
MTNKGLLIIISAPSGNGKDAVIEALLKIVPSSTRLITTTSRPPRPGNIEGVDYYFISKEEFENKIKNNEFLEYNFYADNYYGTEKNILENNIKKNKVVFLNIDVNGKHNLDKAKVKNLSIFLLPDSLEILKNRIRQRGGISEELIEERIKTAKYEIENSLDYDYRIVNENGKLDETIDKLAKIILSTTNDS